MFSLFARAFDYANLTPFERSVLRFIEGLVGTALLAGFQAASPQFTDAALANPASIAWGSVLHTFIAGFILSLYLAGRKFFSAQADPPIPPPAASDPSVSPALPASPDAAVSVPASAVVPAAVSVPDGVLPS